MEKKKILIVEDEQLIAHPASVFIEDFGYEVAGVIESGEEAINFVKNHKVDLILMDIYLKGKMNGVEVMNIIRSFINLPVIYVSGAIDENLLEKAKLTHPYNFVLKPYGSKDLEIAIDFAFYNFEVQKKKKETEEALKISKEKYKALFETNSDGILLLDLKTGEITNSNNSLKKIFDLCQNGIKNTIQDILLFPNVKNYIEKFCHNCSQNMSPCSVRYELTKQNDKKMQIEVILQIIQLSKKRLLQLTFRDISSKEEIKKINKSRIKYEKALANYSEILLENPDPKIAYPKAISLLLDAVVADRVYIYENIIHPDFGLSMELIAEECSDNCFSRGSNIFFKLTPYERRFSRWQEILSKGKIISGKINKFPHNERDVLAAIEVQSLIIAPIIVSNLWYGFIGFETIDKEREWTISEGILIRTAAKISAAYIMRERYERKISEKYETTDEYLEITNNIKFQCKKNLVEPLEKITQFLEIIKQENNISGYSQSSVKGIEKQLIDIYGLLKIHLSDTIK